MAEEEGIYNQVCFHSHQCAEKSLKAFIARGGKYFSKTHSLTELALICAKSDKSFSKYVIPVKSLDRYYIPTRYPDAILGSLKDGMPNRKDAEEALETASEVYVFVKSKIRPES